MQDIVDLEYTLYTLFTGAIRYYERILIKRIIKTIISFFVKRNYFVHCEWVEYQTLCVWITTNAI